MTEAAARVGADLGQLELWGFGEPSEGSESAETEVIEEQIELIDFNDLWRAFFDRKEEI